MRRVVMAALFAAWVYGIVWFATDRTAEHVPQSLIEAVESRRRAERLWVWRSMTAAYGPSVTVTANGKDAGDCAQHRHDVFAAQRRTVATSGDNSLRLSTLDAPADDSRGAVELRVLHVAPCLVNASAWDATVHEVGEGAAASRRPIDHAAPGGALVVDLIAIESDAACPDAVNRIVDHFGQSAAVSTLAIVARTSRPVTSALAPSERQASLQPPLVVPLPDASCHQLQVSPEGAWLRLL